MTRAPGGSRRWPATDAAGTVEQRLTPALAAQGWTPLPNELLTHFRRLGLGHHQVVFVANILRLRSLALREGRPWPWVHRGQLARELEVSERSISEWKDDLKARGYLLVSPRRWPGVGGRGADELDLSPLFARLENLQSERPVAAVNADQMTPGHALRSSRQRRDREAQREPVAAPVDPLEPADFRTIEPADFRMPNLRISAPSNLRISAPEEEGVPKTASKEGISVEGALPPSVPPLGGDAPQASPEAKDGTKRKRVPMPKTTTPEALASEAAPERAQSLALVVRRYFGRNLEAADVRAIEAAHLERFHEQAVISYPDLAIAFEQFLDQRPGLLAPEIAPGAGRLVRDFVAQYYCAPLTVAA